MICVKNFGSRARKRARKELLMRDGPACWLCGKVPEHGKLTIDHVIPKSAGGTHHIVNLKLACRFCNEYRAWPQKTRQKILAQPPDVRRTVYGEI